MLTTFALLLTLSTIPELALTPPPVGLDAPSLAGSPRSVSLLEQETVKLERRVVSASRLLPAWVPLVAGVGGGALASGLGYLMLTTLGGFTLGTLGQAFLGAVFLVAGPIFAVAGIIVGLVFAVKNVDRQERLAALQDDLERSRDALSLARDVARHPSLTLVEF